MDQTGLERTATVERTQGMLDQAVLESPCPERGRCRFRTASGGRCFSGVASTIRCSVPRNFDLTRAALEQELCSGWLGLLALTVTDR